MLIQKRYVITLTGLYLFMMSCANIIAPTGGPRDEKAPTITKRTLNDSSLNFKGGKINFDFNEFVKLQDVQNQLIITPFTKVKPKVTAHKRRVTVYLHDSLLEKNTTYHISMGNAIQDIHEGNSIQNLGFTFSTGPYFDSLSLQGSLIDAATGLPDTASYILLYPANLPDSAFMKQKPMYAQKTTQGLFRFENLPNRDFSIYALQENNKNYQYDGNGERIAFYDKKVNPIDSTLNIQLYSFTELDSRDTARKKGLKTTPQKPTEKPEVKLNYTVNIDSVNKTKRTFDLNNPIKIQFFTSLKSLDISKIRLFQDEVFDASAIANIDTSGKSILFQTDWAQDATYTLKLMKGFAFDSNGKQAMPSEYTFKTKKQSDYGFITVRCEQNENTIIELIKADKVIAQKKAVDSVVAFKLLLPDNYQLRVIHDENKNGKWDTGQFIGKKRQPELTEFIPNQITIKANWENNVDIRKRANNKRKK